MKTTITILVLIALIAGGGLYYTNSIAAQSGPIFRAEKVKRGDLLPTIAATGTVEPEEVIDVGAQVVGRIIDFGIDPSDPEKKKRVDYKSAVHEGTDLAYIDDEKYL